MSLVGLGRLTREANRDAEVGQALREAPEATLDRYSLSEEERDAVLDLDAARLVELGLNPMVMRNLLVAAGVDPWADLYTHDRTLRRAPRGN